MDAVAHEPSSTEKPGPSKAGFLYTVETLRVPYVGASPAELSLEAPLDLPGVLGMDPAGNGGGLRLRSLKEVEQDLRALAAYAERQATASESCIRRTPRQAARQYGAHDG